MGAYVTINPTPSGDITGSGTAGYLAMFTSANVIGDSMISQSGPKVYVGASNAFVVNTSTIGMSIGYDLQSVTIAGVTYNIGLSIHNESGTYVNQELHAASALTTVGAILLGNRSRGTNASPTVVQSADNLFDIYACGYDGTDYAISSSIEMEVDATVAANQVPGRIKISTANSSGTLTERLRIDSGGAFTFSDGSNFIFNTGTGTKIGTATNQKLSFWNATPIVQPTTAVAAATFVANTSANAVYNESTFDGYTIAQAIKALRNTGLLA